MPVIAFLVLLWQRRRVLSLFRRAREGWADRPATAAAAPSARAARTASWIGARAWKAIDTPQNAARAERLIARLRTAAAQADGGSRDATAA